MLLEGAPNSGKTALAASLAKQVAISNHPYHHRLHHDNSDGDDDDAGDDNYFGEGMNLFQCKFKDCFL